MPQHKTHLFLGFLAYILLLYLILFLGPLVWSRKIELLVCTLIGALFPDIDTKSKIQRIIYIMLFVVILLCMYIQNYLAAACCAVVACVPLMVHHRSLFHKPLFITALVGCVIFLTHLYIPVYTHAMLINGIFFLAGVFSHLGADKRF